MFWLFIILGVVILGLATSIWILIVLFYTRVPFVKMPARHITTLLEAIHITSADTVYDLGCGDAHVLIKIAERTGARTVGFDISPIAYLKAKWNIQKAKTTTKVYFKDFRNVDISQANIIFVFLIVGIMERTWNFLLTHARPGTRVISYGFSFPGIIPDQTISTSSSAQGSQLYIYTIPLTS